MADPVQVLDSSFFALLLDNLSDGIYVLDNRMRFVYVNAAYCMQLQMTKEELLGMDVHEFLKTDQIDFCIADMVHEQKKQIVLFQDVYDALGTGRKTFRQLVIATPLFDEKGEIRYYFSLFRRLARLNEEYRLANCNGINQSRLAGEAEEIAQENIVAESPQMRSILSLCRTVADTDASVLITGDSGSGKEVIAHYLHDVSSRRDAPLVIINCASLPENLLEAELFGYEKGAYTGAVVTKKGLFEQANHGTLFLDEINSMPMSLQGKLLRAIETKVIRHLGSNMDRAVDFRLLVATNENLEELVRARKFRKDLYYRINVIPIHIPALRERKEDIIPLALQFLKSFCDKNGKDKSFSPQMLERIRDYSWPGNVRELKNFVERSILMTMEQTISIPEITGFTAFTTDNSSDFKIDSGTDTLLDEMIRDGDTDPFGNSPENRKNTDRLTAFTQDPKQTDSQGDDFSRFIRDGMTIGSYLDEKEYALLKWAQQTCGSTYKMAELLGTSQAAIMRRKKKYHL